MILRHSVNWKTRTNVVKVFAFSLASNIITQKIFGWLERVFDKTIIGWFWKVRPISVCANWKRYTKPFSLKFKSNFSPNYSLQNWCEAKKEVCWSAKWETDMIDPFCLLWWEIRFKFQPKWFWHLVQCDLFERKPKSV